ncbi:MAG: type II toxin-antitoxin system VapC family toxin [Gemmatimonadota bacterium]|nr:type II toxin-antitoxin system VapC family toxin [Gemmatimonadota bacterium]MDE2986159.1 type II toxin-antitoxin system VapC family toxin [Gemmatimonadota bacterium]
MRPIAYIETTVVSYLTARPSRDVVILAHQQATREWWRTAQEKFHLAASALVIREAGQGDPTAARARLMALDGVTLLDATAEAEQLARELIALGAVSPGAAVDAAHIAIAVTNRVHYLVTWNFRHIANAAMRSRIERVCRSTGYEPPVICTPHELMEVSHGDQ